MFIYYTDNPIKYSYLWPIFEQPLRVNSSVFSSLSHVPDCISSRKKLITSQLSFSFDATQELIKAEGCHGPRFMSTHTKDTH